MLAESIAAPLMVADVLDSLGVAYAIGGSLAGAIHGVVRTTIDADFVADLHMEHAAPLVQMLSDEFYVDLATVRAAISHHSSFNLIHLETMFKVDIFVVKPRSFDRAQLARRELHLLNGKPLQSAYFVSAEDIVLAKLEWYRQTGETSDRQWRDVLGVLQVQGERLDYNYMRGMSMELNMGDLLEKAFEQGKK